MRETVCVGGAFVEPCAMREHVHTYCKWIQAVNVAG